MEKEKLIEKLQKKKEKLLEKLAKIALIQNQEIEKVNEALKK